MSQRAWQREEVQTLARCEEQRAMFVCLLAISCGFKVTTGDMAALVVHVYYTSSPKRLPCTAGRLWLQLKWLS